MIKLDQTKEEMDKNQQITVIRNIKINELHDFEKHPFKVENDKELFELMKSIEEEGVLVPLLARPNPNGDGFEIIAGHRREFVIRIMTFQRKSLMQKEPKRKKLKKSWMMSVRMISVFFMWR